MRYVLAIDQSTQGTKAILLNEQGELVCRCDRPHRQILSEQGWISHDPEEIYENVLLVAGDVIKKAGITPGEIVCMGLSNQRETTVVWERDTGAPVCHAVVWQCSRAKEVCRRCGAGAMEGLIWERTGIPLSPYFPAAKMAWVLENVPGVREKNLCMGTVDTWLVWKLTGEYRTDYSNASRTQLFNIHTLQWDEDICRAFGVNPADLAEVTDSDGLFGYTDLGGLLPKKIPLLGVLGDSHAALFAQGCLEPGMAKATYGTGSSVMMQVGAAPVKSRHGLVSSLAWKAGGEVNYVLEGNINYTGAVITWLKEDVGLIASPGETEALAMKANPEDTTCLVPAFTGLGAPYWKNNARALICGMSPLTGKAELVKAALDSIACQIQDVVKAMEQDTGKGLLQLRTDGGATKNGYLMQFQSDLLGTPVRCARVEELSAVGAGYMAGMAFGLWGRKILQKTEHREFVPRMPRELAEEKYRHWQAAVAMAVNAGTEL